MPGPATFSPRIRPTIGGWIGTRVNIGVAVDPDAKIYIDALISAGATLSAPVRTAIDVCFKQLKAAGVYLTLNCWYPFIGGSLATCAINARNPGTNNMTWDGCAANANGVITGGAGDHGDTGFNLNTTTPNSLAFDVYSLTDLQENDPAVGASNNQGAQIFPSAGGTALFDNQLNAGTGRVSAAVANTLGMFTSSRTASNVNIGYKNGVAITATGTGVQGTLQNETFTIITVDSFGTSNRRYANYGIGAGRSGAQELAYYNAIQALQTALGRAV